MNRENPGAAPGEAPAATTATTEVAAQATADTAPAPIVDANAPDAVPDQPADVPPDVAPEAVPAPTAEVEVEAAPDAPTATAAANTPGLSPAACGARLAELFPALFIAPGAPGPAKPIKLRIHADIQARAPGVFSKRVLGIFFSRYTTTNAYLKALAAAPHRFDLDGAPADEIAAEHRQAAIDELARRHALAAERRAAQRPPARGEAPVAQGDASAEAPRDMRPPRRDDGAPEGKPQRPSRPARDHRQRPDRREGARAPAPGNRPPHPRDRPAHDSRPQRPQQVRETPPPAALPVDPAQRERAMLLRNFEASPLSKANFCALKGITEAALDAALAQAQTERAGNGR